MKESVADYRASMQQSVTDRPQCEKLLQQRAYYQTNRTSDMDIEQVAAHSPTRIADASRRAAVLVPVVTSNTDRQLLFTERTEHLNEYPGQMSFLGGSREPENRSLIDTAFREANEEIGLRSDETTVIGRLDEPRSVHSLS